jgi:putative DNA methylase
VVEGAVRKKLIEVALPLEAINKASAREKSIRHGHPSTLHLWWARRPLAAARAVIFAQMVDDPSAKADLFPTEEEQEQERQRLFKIIEDLVQWENTTNEEVLNRARAEIWQSWQRACAENADHPLAKELFNATRLPAFHDPFAGGGSLPLEAQRLGLEAYASDLNPVAVLICKAMIEIPPRFAGRPPVNPEARNERALVAREWKGAQGIAEDVRYYGKWMRDEAERRIGHLYPKIEITPELAKERPDLKPLVGERLTVIAWLWARTVRSPNPAFAHVEVPLASTFMLSTKKGKEAYVEPVIEEGGYRFTVKVGRPRDVEGVKSGTKMARGANFRCVMSGVPISGDYIKAEGKAGRMGARLMAIVAEGDRGRVYVAPTAEHEAIARAARSAWRPEGALPDDPRNFWTVQYGLTTYGDLFTPRQLVALTTFSDLVGEAMARAKEDALAAGIPDDGTPLRDGGTGAGAYAEAVGVYLAFALSKACNRNTSLCIWEQRMDRLVATFGRQALPMVWDYAETNPLAGAGGDIFGTVVSVVEVVERQFSFAGRGSAVQVDAVRQCISSNKLISTDPPYYDNIGYADLSDFFYVWLRRCLRGVFPELLATIAVPKAGELVATPYRHGSKDKAEMFFLEGMTRAMHRLAEHTHPAFPVTIYYAFKQSESETNIGSTSTGWETFLDAVIYAGFGISGTWPVRTEQPKGLRAFEQNALASSIVLVCRKRPADAPTATRREFVAALKAELPKALGELQKANIAPVDLAQAAIGPGMAVYTRYARVSDAEGKPVGVREALALINQVLDETLAQQESDFEPETRWALAWFEQYGFSEGEFGVAETLSKAKDTSVQRMVEAGVLESKRGKVRLLRPDDLPNDWDPESGGYITIWEMVHHLIRVLESGGEKGAAGVLAKLGSRAETARELAYRLYTVSDRKKRAQDALRYNALVQSWPEIVRLARESGAQREEQTTMFGGEPS